MPSEALNHPLVTLSHLVDYSHCANVKASVQMMEVCRRHVFAPQPAPAAAAAPAAPAQLVNLVPTSVGNVAITFNNQLPNQVVSPALRVPGFTNCRMIVCVFVSTWRRQLYCVSMSWLYPVIANLAT